MIDPLKPSLTLLVKLGSIAVHVDEMRTAPPSEQPYDRAALSTLLEDYEVVEWIKAMSKKALLPVKRR